VEILCYFFDFGIIAAVRMRVLYGAPTLLPVDGVNLQKVGLRHERQNEKSLPISFKRPLHWPK